MNSNFGKYDVPSTLQKLIALHNKLGDPEQFYLGLNFYLSLENFRYFNTPSDVVVFGNIGADGIHYGFLTDFGSVPDLETAPIVCICPMDFDRPTRIVAENLSEFLRVNLADSALFYNEFNSEKDYLAAKEKWAAEAANSPYPPTENEKNVRKGIEKFLMENIEMPNIDRPYRYIQLIEQERNRKISIETLDGLGVTAPLLRGEEHMPVPINMDTDLDLEWLQHSLFSAPVASQFAFFRDVQLHSSFQDNPEVHKIVMAAMKKLGLNDEANRLSDEVM